MKLTRLSLNTEAEYVNKVIFLLHAFVVYIV